MQANKVTKEAFISFIKSRKYADESDFVYLYEIYEMVIETVNEVSNQAKNEFNVDINHYIVILYILNEYKYFLFTIKNRDKSDVFENTDSLQMIASLCADKFLTNEKLNFKSEAFLNRFNPPISTLDLYLNFSLRTLERISFKDRGATLIRDMLLKALKMGKCILTLLIDGFETEAFSTWRTLHENECIMLCLVKNGKEMYEGYFKHIRYALAYRGQIKNKEEVDAIFEEIKSEMKKHGLKSKDMKKFIEYGYLYTSKEITPENPIKLNFRDGVQKLAGLSSYAKIYEMASEIAHSSPLLLFSRRSYYFEITILNLYESFFRLEMIFEALYKSANSKEVIEQYERMKKIYLGELHSIYSICKATFLSNKKISNQKWFCKIRPNRCSKPSIWHLYNTIRR